MAAYRFAGGDGHVGKDAMNIPDYVAIALLLMMLLDAKRAPPLPAALAKVKTGTK